MNEVFRCIQTCVDELEASLRVPLKSPTKESQRGGRNTVETTSGYTETSAIAEISDVRVNKGNKEQRKEAN